MELPEIRNAWLFLNQLAQGVYSQDIGILYFNGLSQENKKLTLTNLAFMASQAHATESDIQAAKEQARLPSNYDSCFQPPDEYFAGRLTPVNEEGFGREFDRCDFIFLLTVFTIANNRRRLQCGSTCRHWWHQDLGNRAIVEELFPR